MKTINRSVLGRGMEHESKLLSLLNEAIPLTKAMGIRVECFTGESLTIVGPLENNFNHLGTAFGGSLYITAVLSCWGLLYLRLRELGVRGQIVIQKGTVEYYLPVTGDIVASSTMVPEASFLEFLEEFKEKGSAKMTLSSAIMQSERKAVSFEGIFVLQQKKSDA